MENSGDFLKDLARGKLGEDKLDDYFSTSFDIEMISVDNEIELGYDRIFKRKKDGKQFKVEYKTDYMTLKTGNCFLELEVFTYSSQTSKPGWVYHSKSDIIVYHISPIAILFRCEQLRNFVDKNISCYRQRKTRNDVNEATGLIVPYLDLYEDKTVTIAVKKIGE